MIKIKIKVHHLNKFPLNIQMDLFNDEPRIVNISGAKKKSYKIIKLKNNRKEQLRANLDENSFSDQLREGLIKCTALERFLASKIQSLRKSSSIS